MKRTLLILTLGLGLAAAGYEGAHWAASAPARREMCAPDPGLAWLKDEFKVDDAAFGRMAAMHAAYVAQCQERCAVIASNNALLTARIVKNGGMTPAIEKEMDEIARLRADCEKETLKHFLAVSRLMPPEQGQRYLAWILEQAFPCHSASDAACHSAMKP